MPSNFIGSDDKKSSQTIEEYLQEWLNEPSSKKQIALLGEYGQGKSTAALMFVYHMIELAKQNKVRIPILIELRGKSPRNLTPPEILATWASQYRIDPQALLRLHIAGRLLLIFEGFDEMALIGNFEARLQHFRRLWEFCYPQAKILITGRPNFFLDDEEMRLALGISQPNGDNHYCEAIRLAPFSIEQIEESLREQKPEIKEQICSVAKTNSGFRDLVARPSLLHVVSVIWEQENLGEQVENLNSAYVMERFVKNSYRRQGLKAVSSENQSRKYFMALNTSEREYFMSGIAAYMASKKLSNQISAIELNKLIEDLIDVIPDSVSTSVDAMSGEDRRPLKSRIREPKEDIEHIKTDVRTCGLLVDDPAVLGTFKFGHKSFMEYLFAVTISNLIVKSKQQDTQAILKATKASINHIIDLSVSIEFLLEIIIQNNFSIRDAIDKENQLFSVANFLFEKLIKIKKTNFLLRLICLVLILIGDRILSKVLLVSLASIFCLYSFSYTFLLFFKLLFGVLYEFIGYLLIPLFSIISYPLSSFVYALLLLVYIYIISTIILMYNSRLIFWIQICKMLNIEDKLVHKVIGTNKMPILKNKKFDYVFEDSYFILYPR